ncbi:MAG: periplasmic heavy metal sensor [Caulobacteraceae bacterium]|nr:periplasmic heavy metal sensor [Caulobacteraceae bacterium]
MSSRLLAIILGIALAVSVGINLFAATAAVTALSGQKQIERALQERRTDQSRPSTRELLASLDPEVRRAVRRGLRDAGLAARPDFQAARQARAEAVEAAKAEPFDRARVEALLTESRAAEARGRARLEADALALMETLEPEDRRVVAALLAGRGRGVDRRDREPRQERVAEP